MLQHLCVLSGLITGWDFAVYGLFINFFNKYIHLYCAVPCGKYNNKWDTYSNLCKFSRRSDLYIKARAGSGKFCSRYEKRNFTVMGRADGLHRGRNEGRFSGRGSIFDASWRRGTWLRGNEGRCFRRQGPSEQRSRVRKVRDTGKEPVTESRRAWSTAGVEDRQEGSPPSLPSLLFLLHILRFWGLGPNVRTAVPTALTCCPARDHTGGSRVLVHGLMETPARLVWRKVGQEGHQGGVPLSFRAGYPQIAGRQTSNRHRLAGSRNRLNIAARRQERHPVVIEQMGEEGVGSEGNGKSRGEKVGRPQMFWGSCGYIGQNTHMVWMEPQPEHMVSAEEDATGKHRRGAWRRLFRSIKISALGVWRRERAGAQSAALASVCITPARTASVTPTREPSLLSLSFLFIKWG